MTIIVGVIYILLELGLLALIVSVISLLVTLPLILLAKCLPHPLRNTAVVGQTTLASAALLSFLSIYVLSAWCVVEITLTLMLISNVNYTSNGMQGPRDPALLNEGLRSHIKQELWPRALLLPGEHFCYTQNGTACQYVDREQDRQNGEMGWSFYLFRLSLGIYAVGVAVITHTGLYPRRNLRNAFVNWLGWATIAVGLWLLVALLLIYLQ